MQRPRHRVPALTFAGMVATACGASSLDVNNKGNGDSEDARAACAEFATTLCARRWECIPLAFERGYGFHDSFETESVCVERMSLACEGWQRLPGTRAQPAALRDCAAQIAELECKTSTHTLTYPAGGCELGRGLLGEGEPCEVHLQCESGDCSRRGGEGTCGPNAIDGAEPEVGDPCPPAGCGENLVCHGDVCVAPALGGETCGEGAPPCAQYAELRCDESGVCEGHPTSEGSCGYVDGEYVACVSGECLALSDLGFGRCVPYAGDDEGCNVSAGPVCLYPAQCADDGRCRVPGF